MENTESDRDLTVDVQAEDDGVVINISSNQLDSDDEVGQQNRKSSRRRQGRRHALTKARSVSESSGDELTSTSTVTGTFSKGILKSRHTHEYSRSVSESSADENGMPTSSIDYHYGSVQDINSESDCSSLKKTVRFNDVVSRQLFRYSCDCNVRRHCHAYLFNLLDLSGLIPASSDSVRRINVNCETRSALLSVG